MLRASRFHCRTRMAAAFTFVSFFILLVESTHPSEICSRTCIIENCNSFGIRYGKYCGVGYSGCPGEKPCDDLDACCQIHDDCVDKKGPSEITTRWTVVMTSILHPWKPKFVLTGTSVMGINPNTSMFCNHVDCWDSIKNNDYFSLEGLMEVLKQLRYFKAPDLESPKYLVLKRTTNYERSIAMFCRPGFAVDYFTQISGIIACTLQLCS